MQTLGIIGSGNIGSAIARLAVASDMEVVLANSRAPETLQGLVDELGPLATTGTVEQAMNKADVIILSVPLIAIKDTPAKWLGNKIVLDTSNYYPSRDGRIEDLDTALLTEGELVHDWLGGPRLVKAFSNILAHHIPQLARRSEELDRSALPVASNDRAALRDAAVIIDRLGFDVVEVGLLSEAWRFEPESAAYTRIYLADPETPDDRLLSAVAGPTSSDQVRAALASAARINVAARVF